MNQRPEFLESYIRIFDSFDSRFIQKIRKIQLQLPALQPSGVGAHTQIKYKIFCIRPRTMQNILDFDSLDQSLLDSTYTQDRKYFVFRQTRSRSFAFDGLRYKIAWICLPSQAGLCTTPRTWLSIFAKAGYAHVL
jgi:hypothetical protein